MADTKKTTEKQEDLITTANKGRRRARIRRASEVKDFKPVSKERILKEHQKPDDIIIYPEWDENEEEGWRFRYPTKMDYVLSTGNLILPDIQDATNMTDDEAKAWLDMKDSDEYFEHQITFVQRLLQDPDFSIDELHQLTRGAIVFFYDALDDIFATENEVYRFRGVGESEQGTDN